MCQDRRAPGLHQWLLKQILVSTSLGECRLWCLLCPCVPAQPNPRVPACSPDCGHFCKLEIYSLGGGVKVRGFLFSFWGFFIPSSWHLDKGCSPEGQWTPEHSWSYGLSWSPTVALEFPAAASHSFFTVTWMCLLSWLTPESFFLTQFFFLLSLLSWYRLHPGPAWLKINKYPNKQKHTLKNYSIPASVLASIDVLGLIFVLKLLWWRWWCYEGSEALEHFAHWGGCGCPVPGSIKDWMWTCLKGVPAHGRDVRMRWF